MANTRRMLTTTHKGACQPRLFLSSRTDSLTKEGGHLNCYLARTIKIGSKLDKRQQKHSNHDTPWRIRAWDGPYRATLSHSSSLLRVSWLSFDGVFGTGWPTWPLGSACACVARVDRRVTGERVSPHQTMAGRDVRGKVTGDAGSSVALS